VRWLCTYDLLNKIINEVVLHSRRHAEVSVVVNQISRIPNDVIVVYDRGFASYAVPWLHMHYGSNCIVRVKTTFNPTVIDFIQSVEAERIVESFMPERASRSLRKLGFDVKRSDLIRYRLIRVDLPSGETEVLMTTLFNRNKFHYRHFAHLYALKMGGRDLFPYPQKLFSSSCLCFFYFQQY
jgi:hypothetical protein